MKENLTVCFISPRSHHVMQIFIAISAALIIVTYQFAFAAGDVTRSVKDGGIVAAYGLVMAIALVLYACIKAAAIAYSTHVAHTRLVATPIGTGYKAIQYYNFLTARVEEKSFDRTMAFVYALIVIGACTGVSTAPMTTLVTAAGLFAIVNVIGGKVVKFCTDATTMPTLHDIMRPATGV